MLKLNSNNIIIVSWKHTCHDVRIKYSPKKIIFFKEFKKIEQQKQHVIRKQL